MKRPSPWTVLTVLVVAVVVASHLAFLLLDARMPRDLSLLHRDLPDLVVAFDQGAGRRLLGALVEPGGWYTLLYAVVLTVGGLDPAVYRAVDLLFVAVAVAAGARVAARMWDGRAGLAAAMVLGAIPAVVVLGRSGWVHVPETALVLLALDTWLGDGQLERRRTRVVLAVLALLATSLRPSALIWLGPLALAMIAGSWRRPTRLVGPALGLLLGTALWLPRIGLYMQAKLDARARYLEAVPDLRTQLPEVLAGSGMLVLGVGLLLSLGLPVLRGQRLLQTWALLPVLLFASTRTGIDNFVPGIVAAALLAARGLARWPVLGLPLAGASLLLFTGLQWSPPDNETAQSIARSLQIPARPGLRNNYRVYGAWGGADLRALVSATCGHDPCRIAVDQGLLQPYGEEPGKLELMLLDLPQLKMIELRTGPGPDLVRLDALMHWDCGTMDHPWRQRYPASVDALMGLLDGSLDATGDKPALAPAWSRPLDGACRPLWFTPGGEVDHPERLPPGSDILPGAAAPPDHRAPRGPAPGEMRR